MTKLHQLIDKFLASTTGLADQSRVRYASALKSFERCNIKLDDDCLCEFDRHLRELVARSRKSQVSILTRFVEWCEANSHIKFSTGKARAKLRAQRGHERAAPYPVKQIDQRMPQLLDFLRERIALTRTRSKRQIALRDYALVLVLFSTGARIAEVLSMTREMVADGANAEPLVVGKGGHQRFLFLSPTACDAIKQYCAARSDNARWLFVTQGGALKRSSIECLFREWRRELGLSETTSPHAIRHYVATQALNRGMPLEMVQAYLGHQHIQTTRMVYAHTNIATLRQHVKRFHASSATEQMTLF